MAVARMVTRTRAFETPTNTSSARPPTGISFPMACAMPASGAWSQSVPSALATPSGPLGSGTAG